MTMKQKCPRCQTDWPSDVRNCPDCGERTIISMNDPQNPYLAALSAIVTMPVPRVRRALIALIVIVLAAVSGIATFGSSGLMILIALGLVLIGIGGVGVAVYLDLRAFFVGDVEED